MLYFDPRLVNKRRYESHKRAKRNCEKKSCLVFSLLVFFLIGSAIKDGGSNDKITFGTVLSFEFRKEIYVICRLGGPYGEKLLLRSQFFTIRTDP